MHAAAIDRHDRAVKLRIVALGHRMPAWVAAGYGEYAKRMPREYALELVELKPARARRRQAGRATARGRSAAHSRGVRRISRWSRWTSAAPRGPRASWRSGCERWRDAAQDVAFVIGSADGLDASVKRDAAAVFALSALTLPHGLARVMLAEQLYRAASVLGGHPYHRD